ncbi:MAG: hypothetical protein AAFV46_00110 [Cyanobacteria bacterium J06635_11]
MLDEDYILAIHGTTVMAILPSDASVALVDWAELGVPRPTEYRLVTAKVAEEHLLELGVVI